MSASLHSCAALRSSGCASHTSCWARRPLRNSRDERSTRQSVVDLAGCAGNGTPDGPRAEAHPPEASDPAPDRGDRCASLASRRGRASPSGARLRAAPPAPHADDDLGVLARNRADARHVATTSVDAAPASHRRRRSGDIVRRLTYRRSPAAGASVHSRRAMATARSELRSERTHSWRYDRILSRHSMIELALLGLLTDAARSTATS